ncbi:MAG: hypothetical protein MPJ24_08555 [Pirellulaceae bacterium]|nr:hypothetical protein [Pirellulaceae bacterium]
MNLTFAHSLVRLQTISGTLFWGICVTAVCIFGLLAPLCYGQDLLTQAETKQDKKLRPRVLAPGVLTTIAPDLQEADAKIGPRRLIEVANGLSDLTLEKGTLHFQAEELTAFEKTKTAIIRRNIHCLEISFKPVRMIEVDVPHPDGEGMEKKLIWYMVYRIRNLGNELVPYPQKNSLGQEVYHYNRGSRKLRFYPNFILKSQDQEKEYLSQFIPVAIDKIQQREDPALKFHSSVEISSIDIPVSDGKKSQEVWGVATWASVDPNTDYFSIYVKGLSNAYQYTDADPDAKDLKTILKGRKIQQKTLQLNFWRPGDEIDEKEEEVRFGLPYTEDPFEKNRLNKLYDIKKPLAHLWIYR